jgi:hypothetical protein
VDVVRDPGCEEARPNQVTQRITDRHPNTGFDGGVDVHDTGDVLDRVHQQEPVVLGGVGLRRRPHFPDVEHLARDG